jgi:hypothetical protein
MAVRKSYVTIYGTRTAGCHRKVVNSPTTADECLAPWAAAGEWFPDNAPGADGGRVRVLQIAAQLVIFSVLCIAK